MIELTHLEALLKANGITKTAPDEQIRSVLMSARFEEHEIKTALMVLRENMITKETKVDGLHKVFRSDQLLKPAEISKLLGIDINVSEPVHIRSRKQKHFSMLEFMILWIISIVIALITILFYMYSNNMGLFHPTSAMAHYGQ